MKYLVALMSSFGTGPRVFLSVIVVLAAGFILVALWSGESTTRMAATMDEDRPAVLASQPDATAAPSTQKAPSRLDRTGGSQASTSADTAERVPKLARGWTLSKIG